MGAMSSHITSLTIVYPRVYSAKLRVTGLCEGDSLVTGEFPAQRASKAENVSIWSRHHGFIVTCMDEWVGVVEMRKRMIYCSIHKFIDSFYSYHPQVRLTPQTGIFRAKLGKLAFHLGHGWVIILGCNYLCPKFIGSLAKVSAAMSDFIAKKNTAVITYPCP